MPPSVFPPQEKSTLATEKLQTSEVSKTSEVYEILCVSAPLWLKCLVRNYQSLEW